ncbi:unnamed protein product [Cylicocyclus nassatus]|uniref:Tyrosine-protein kinase ephrin type A/B receptor-like domain-containing protein n=1 Tax=Cylicocyclus nassatus TaxID=53992 RepID=A0AA36H274_CYLNA|nr:unnamed protein product [Cylicocyclus nassatus]
MIAEIPPRTTKYIYRLLLLWCVSFVSGRFCDPSDYKYEYTECQPDGSRWRVAIPHRSGDCDLPPPTRGLNCSFSCSSGNYLDIMTQSCRPCPPGQYSLGGGSRFEEFYTLPTGFSIENFDPSSMSLDTSPAKVEACPPETGWLIRDAELLYVPTPCVSRLSFSANLVRPGFVEFSYRMPKNNKALSLQVDVRNQQCQSYREAMQSMLTKYAGNSRTHKEESNGDWQKRVVDLRTGANVVSWTVTNSAGAKVSSEPIRVSRIDVLGLAFTRECSLCPAGTYSTGGVAECTPCAAGYYAPKGAATCGRCPQTQFSGPKAERCTERPACRSSDYYPVTEPCANGTTRTTYKKVQPAVCREDLPEAAKMPSPSATRECPPCNPGMAKDSNGVCVFCPAEHFSQGDACIRCPVETVPNYGYEYVQWDTVPPNIVTRCEYISEEVSTACDIGEAWMASGSALVSAPSLQKGIALEMELTIAEGFSNPMAPVEQPLTQQAPVAHVSIVFETTCADSSCVLYMIESPMERTKTSQFRFLAAFNGTQPRRVWSHSVLRRRAARFLVAFLRSGATSGDDAILDQARILSVNVTNVGTKTGKQGGGASRCLPCPSGQFGQCIPCPPGHFMTPGTHQCALCPPNTVANTSSDRIGIETCITCGENLHALDGVACRSQGLISVVKDNKTLNYDLSSWVKKTWTTTAVKVFAREGSSYYHSFNFSLFGGDKVECKEVYDSSDAFSLVDQNRETISGAACRLTVLPDIGSNHTKLASVSPLLLATRLEEISLKRNREGWTLTDQLLEYEGTEEKSRPIDIHFWYDTVGVPSEACPKGNALVITVRCMPNKKQPEVRLPRTCPDGTCDGCLFHAIVGSVQACPICGIGDYDMIRGECVDGQQTIHYIPDKHCVLTGKEAQSRKEACSSLSQKEKMFLAFGTTMFAILCVALVIICQRNRKLEYKYTRLIESRNGELPAAETCGLEDDEEDEGADRVIFAKGKRKIFGGRDTEAFVPLENED